MWIPETHMSIISTVSVKSREDAKFLEKVLIERSKLFCPFEVKIMTAHQKSSKQQCMLVGLESSWPSILKGEALI